jgi:tetratricopeptide (TPR) repeat protein
LIVASIALTACSASPGKVEIRSVGQTAARAGGDQIAYARGQLVLNNPGLAIEGFRKALREQPDSIDALTGLAAAYGAMGRYDLARRYYEASLAIAPQDPKLLRAFDAVRAYAAAPKTAAVVQATRTSIETSPATPTLAEPRPEAPLPRPTVTIKLPAPRPVIAAAAPPRLERISPGEVALVTTGKPLWRAQVVERTRLSTTVRWLPIRSAASEVPIRLLNAARRQGLAARTRQALFERGWQSRGIAIGDWRHVRANSVVFVPPAHAEAGEKLAAQFGFRVRKLAKGNTIVVLLGRDASGSGSRKLRG